MVCIDVVDGSISTSSHFECASTMIRNIRPRNGQAKSKWILCQGVVGHSQGCIGTFPASFCWSWQPGQLLARCSMSLSILGYQM
jgi:hypothetical protein